MADYLFGVVEGSGAAGQHLVAAVAPAVFASCSVENIAVVGDKNYFESQNYLVCENLTDDLYYLEIESPHKKASFHC